MEHVAIAIWYAAAYQYYLNEWNDRRYRFGMATPAEFVAFGMYGPVGTVYG